MMLMPFTLATVFYQKGQTLPKLAQTLESDSSGLLLKWSSRWEIKWPLARRQ